MLPDFASMSRTRIRGAEDPLVAAGIAFHHRTDDVFHGTETFLGIQIRGADELEARGLGRGPARAVAHVGPELLIDGLLLDDEATCEAYLAAVRATAPARLGLRFAGDGGARFAQLHRRLRGYGLPEDYRCPRRVGHRLVQILARRPRLALAEGDLDAVVPWLEATRRALSARLPRLLEEVFEGLEPAGADGVEVAPKGR
jgi:hypothetical protein